MLRRAGPRVTVGCKGSNRVRFFVYPLVGLIFGFIWDIFCPIVIERNVAMVLGIIMIDGSKVAW